MHAHVKTRTFKTRAGEAIALPEGMGFGIGKEISVHRDGQRVILSEVKDPVDVRREMMELVEALDAIGPVGEIEVRDPFEFPDRPGL